MERSSRMVKKKNNRAILFITIAVLIAVLVTIVVIKAISSNEGYRTISVIETSGTVVVVKDGREYQAYSGMKLQEGYELVTSGNSYARLVLDGDKYIKVEAGSKMVFETLGMLGSGKTRLSLERGAMTSELVSPLKTDEEYVVNTPNAVLAVRGTYFRLDLKPTENGEIVADVVTYGGKVATKRVQPSGEVVEEEVLVEAGRKVCINMDEHKTSYVVEGIKLEETDEDVVIEEVTQPIKIEDIPDEDIVDIYYSAQNGHKLFITEKEVEEKIKDRDIKLEEYVSVYKKAKEVEKKQEGKLVETEVYADDSKPIAIAPEQGMDGEIPKENQIIVGIAPTDGDGVHTHAYVESVSKEATCTEAGEKTFTCECGETYTEELSMLGHTKVTGGTVECHSKCSVCDAIIEDGTMHIYTDAVTASPTCTLVGKKTFTCECGHVFKEEIPMTEHTKVAGGNVDCHSKCSVCELVLEDGTKHVYTEMITKEATHSEDGIKTYTCECGYGYEVPIPAQQHIKVNGGTKDCHSKCSDCGAVLEDAMSHSYTTTTLLEPTCTADGTKRLVCACGYEYLELIPALGHDYAKGYSVDKEPTCTAVGSKSRHCVRCESKSGVTQIPMIAHIKVSGGTKDCHSKCSVCGNTIEDATAHSYAETVTKQPTCTEVGTMLYTCSCGYKYSGDIAALGHDYADKFTTDKAPTCTEVGSKSKHCSRCDSVTEIRQVSATGHSYVDKIELPTNTSDGRDYEKCNACGDEINEIPIIAINAVNFPDETVRTYVEANFNSNGEAGLRPEEIAGAINLEIEEGQTVTSLKGVEHLTALERLFVSDASGVSDGEIDVTKNTALTTIALPNAKITKLDVSNSTELQMLMLTGTDIANLDVSANDELLYLYVDNSKLTSLDTSTLSGLYELSCENTDISEIDLSSSNSLSSLFINGCDKLTSLDVSGTSLSEITLSDNTNLETIDISYSDISTIDLSNNKKLVSFIAKGYIGSELVISDCTELTSVELSYATSLSNLSITGCSAFTTHDFSAYSSLKTLDISGSGIESISMTNNTSLTTLTAQESESLETLTLSGCSALVNVDVADSVNLKTMDVGSCASLDNLDISTLSNLEVLDVSETSLTEIDISNNVLIEELDISDTQISYFELYSNTALKSLEARGYIGDELAITESPGLSLVDLEGASGLIVLTVNNTDALKTLDLSSATGLNYIDLTGCSALESVDFTGCADVSTLIMSNAHIAQLDISGLSGLLEIYMDNSSGFDTLDVSSCTGLLSIDMNNCKDIQTFNASGCEELSEVNFVGCSGIKTVDMSGTKMVTIGLNVLSGVESFKAENCASLKVFSCSGNEYLESIDISGCSALTNINIVNCKNLANIDLENDNNLSFVSITGSEVLESLDLSGFTSIQTVTATALTALKSLSVSGCSALSRVDLTGTDGLESFVVTDAGGQSSTGKLQFSFTAADTYYTTDITGWNSLYMEITTSS